ncbi:exo-alpha-sialidase [bacterium]|nr:exo-alpha-sialidase [bacterium]
MANEYLGNGLKILSSSLFKSFEGKPMSHASNILELSNGDILAVWYAGTYETSPDEAILMSRLKKNSKNWEEPKVLVDTPGKADGNPVLFEGNGKVYLFYVTIEGGGLPENVGSNYPEAIKTGTSIKGGWDTCPIKYKISTDFGETFGEERIFRKEWGWMIRNKLLRLSNGEVLFPMYDEVNWKAIFGLSKDLKAWEFTGYITTPKGCIQPAVVELEEGHLLCFLRTRDGFIYRTESYDYGRSWDRSEPTTLKNPNSGIDLIKLKDGKLVVVFNDSFDKRTPLNIGLSEDNGKNWKIWDLETGEGEYSYPSVIQSGNGLIHLVYTYRRETIRHLVLSIE